MNYVNAVIEDKASFDRALDTELPVFVAFISHSCTDAMPRFMHISERYKDQVKVLILESLDP